MEQSIQSFGMRQMHVQWGTAQVGAHQMPLCIVRGHR